MVLILLGLAACYGIDHWRQPDELGDAMAGRDFREANCHVDPQISESTTANPRFLLEIVKSERCGTAWAKITWLGPLDQQPAQIEATIYRMAAGPDGSDARDVQKVQKMDIRAAWTPMIRSGSRGSVCAVGLVEVDGERFKSPVALCD
ncbi:DUF2690 domain-containing protein [Nocardia noduli]|uniref:DUF2690 domain-containing protein n=1 Tax=Nocardia noduli TaxID=2815722 RepID=UPI001C2471B3|nr:DUF2690 domain-containing protein [Nocardia noduli]